MLPELEIEDSMNIMIAADFGHEGGLLTPRRRREISENTLDDSSHHPEETSLQRSTVGLCTYVIHLLRVICLTNK